MFRGRGVRGCSSTGVGSEGERVGLDGVGIGRRLGWCKLGEC
jgi:hypothetical protein